MVERPVIFSAAMVNAIRAGVKTQTRRVVKLQPRSHADIGHYGAGMPFIRHPDPTRKNLMPPYGYPRDRLWVKESHRRIRGQDGQVIEVDYRADAPEKWTRLGDEIGTPTRWVSSLLMRREYSRLLLEITGMRVERLHAITEADAIAEGVHRVAIGSGYHDKFSATPVAWSDVVEQRVPAHDSACFAYRDLWESINGPGTWAANPWVWVVSFQRVEQAHG